ncbi:MAG: SH3 domain-containing protein [Terrimicrobiaceae bacterium]|nr:SH3 domain-containing protein [Terrimicrobiaceae bacterium]
MGPPVLENAEGWRVYDPSENFKPSPGDPIGYIGEKTFEFTLVAREDQRATPPLKFSFFNPETGQYQTLEGPPVAVEARGTSGPAAAASTAAATASPAPAEPEAAPAPGSREELSRDFTPRSFRPAAWAPGFLWAAAGLTILWLAAAAAILVGKRAASPAAARRARLRALRAELRHLASPQLSDLEFLNRAARLAHERLEGKPLDAAPADCAERIEELFAREGEAKFSARGASVLSSDFRSKILEALRALDRALPALMAAGFLWLAGAVQAASIEQGFESYSRGEFGQAAREFEAALATQPPSAGLEYNLGMALKRDGQPGPAALHLLRAMALNPRMADARMALSDLDRSQSIPFRPPNWRDRLAEWVPLPTLLIGGFCLFWLGAFGLLAVWRGFSTGLLLASLAALLLGAGSFVAGYLSDPRFAWRGQSVALSTTSMLAAPAERSQAVAMLAPGSRAQVVNRSGEWVALRLEDGRRGWAPAAAFAPVIPPES